MRNNLGDDILLHIISCLRK